MNIGNVFKQVKQEVVDVHYVMAQCTPSQRFSLTGWAADQLFERLQPPPIEANWNMYLYQDAPHFTTEPKEFEKIQSEPIWIEISQTEPKQIEWQPIERDDLYFLQLERYATAKITRFRIPNDERYLELLFNGRHGLTTELLNELFSGRAYVDSPTKITIFKKENKQ